MKRSEAREQAFFVLFEQIFNADDSISKIISDAEGGELIKINNFARELLSHVEENLSEIDEIIGENSKGWAISRLPKVSLAILRLAIGEMKFSENVPAGVCINEAVEITKKYGTPEDASFVNGILGTVSRKL